MEYIYNILAVNDNGVIIEILYTGNRLPSSKDEMTLKSSKKCIDCNQVIKTKNYILAGNFNVGDTIK